MALQQAMTSSTQAGPAVTSQSLPNQSFTTSKPNDINTIVGGMIDRTPWRWWDTFTWTLASPVVAVPTEVDFFQVAMNQVDPYTNVRKTKLDTNMTAAGQFNPPYCLVMDSIQIQICGVSGAGDVLADIMKFFYGCYVEMKILGKIFFEGLPWMFPGGAGIQGSPNPTGAAADQQWTNGLPAPQYTWRIGKFSRYIAPLTNFSVKMFFPTAVTLASSFQVKVVLDGLSDLPVQ